MNTNWTDDMVGDMLFAIETIGLSYTQTAKYLNDMYRTRFTKNAVTGKIWRVRRAT